MPLLEELGKAFKLSPAQMGAIVVKVGMVLELMKMVSVAAVAHCPTSGVKV
jgi:hypothetical protein